MAATTSSVVSPPPMGAGPMPSMEGTLCVEDDLDKQCNALGALFATIVNEMKVRKGGVAGV